MDDFITYLKAEYLDNVYLQQDAYDPVDGATSPERQSRMFRAISRILATVMDFEDKAAARRFFQLLTQATKDWNRVEMEMDAFSEIENRLERMRAGVGRGA